MGYSLRNLEVIVWGSNHHNTLGVIRSLGEKGISPYVVLHETSENKQWVLSSRYIKKHAVKSSLEEGYNWILSNYEDYRSNPIIIACTDAIMEYIDNNYDSIAPKFHIPNGGGKERISTLQNKETMRLAGIAAGFNTPKSWLIDSTEIPNDIAFPCITKPIYSSHGGKSDIKICNNKEELMSAIEYIKSDVIQIQQMVDVDFEYQLIGCSLNGGKEIIIPGYTNILRANAGSNTGFLEYNPIDDFSYDRKSVELFVRNSRYSGLFSIEFLRGKDGLDYFLEMNFRNDGNTYVVNGAGINLPYIWVTHCANIDNIEEKQKTAKHIIAMPELVDVMNVFRKKVSMKQWVSDLNSSNCLFYYNSKDNKPFYVRLAQIIKSMVSNQFRKLCPRRH